MSLGVLVTVNAPAKQSARSSIGCPLDPGDWPELERPGGDLERWQYKEVLSMLMMLCSPRRGPGRRHLHPGPQVKFHLRRFVLVAVGQLLVCRVL